MILSPTEPDSSGNSNEIDALQKVTIKLSFDRNSPSSIEAAVREFDARIDVLVAPFSGNAFIEEIARQIKSETRDSIFHHFA